LFYLFVQDGLLAFTESLILFLFFIIYIFYTLSPEGRGEVKELVQSAMVKKEKIKSVYFFVLVLRAFGLFLGGKFTVSSVFKISEILNIQSSVLTMIIVALGTSLPEVFVSVGAAFKGKAGIAVGNAFGSNIFNICLVTGVPALYTKVELSEKANSIGIPFFLIATLAVLFATTDDKVCRWEGWGLLVLYVAFVGKLTGLV